MSILFTELASLMSQGRDQLRRSPVVIGFDAFVDEQLRVVAQRHSPEAYTAMPGIADYGAWVSAAAGHSGLREAVCEPARPGGCAVNLGDGLLALGAPLRAYVGVGEPAHPAFADFISSCDRVQALGMEPGRTLVHEFDDGKIMLCSTSHFAAYDADFFRRQLHMSNFVDDCQEAPVIAMTNWSLYPTMTAVWRLLRDELLNGLTHRPAFFFDLVDPASRSVDDLRDILQVIAGYQALGPVTLSLNGNETRQVAASLGVSAVDEAGMAVGIRATLDIEAYVVHLVKEASCATVDGCVTVPGPYCAKPKQSVGAGDRFNAGYLAGQLLGLSPAQRLALGGASSGYFVRNAQSADVDALIAFLQQWSEDV